MFGKARIVRTSEAISKGDATTSYFSAHSLGSLAEGGVSRAQAPRASGLAVALTRPLCADSLRPACGS